MVQGRGIDAPLNDLGRKQAESFFDAYQNVAFDKVYTSALVRTVQSVQGFIDKGIAHESLSGLDEISWGSHEGEVFTPEMHQRYLNVIGSWQKGDLSETVGGGESPLDVVARQKEAMADIMQQEEEETILVAMHGRAMRVLLCWLMNYPLSKMDVFEHQNLCLYLLHHGGSLYTVRKFCDNKHTEGLL